MRFLRGLPRAALFISSCLPFAGAYAGQNPGGLPNFHEVNSNVYRGAQPTPDGFKSLSRLGIKTIIDLRGSEHSEAEEEKIVEANGMRYVSIPMKGMTTPSDEQITSALALLNDETASPVFVHCKRGADRTGAAVACYRIQHDHWDNDKALREARGFGMSWYQLALQHYVEGFGKSADHPIPALIAPPAITR
jgi:tyrosine-protein phosphatase SIW14